MDSLAAWLITEATSTDNWKALGTALIAAFGAAVDFVGTAALAFGKLVSWVFDRKLETDELEGARHGAAAGVRRGAVVRVQGLGGVRRSCRHGWARRSLK